MKKLFIFLIVICLFIAGCVVFFYATPTGRNIWNNWQSNQVVDNYSRYETRENVESLCRQMIESYNNDVLTYNQYKDEEDDFIRSIGTTARNNANQTASQYNEYFERNKNIWNGNIPEDIVSELEII